MEPELDPRALGCLAIFHLPTLALAVPQAGNGCYPGELTHWISSPPMRNGIRSSQRVSADPHEQVRFERLNQGRMRLRMDRSVNGEKGAPALHYVCLDLCELDVLCHDDLTRSVVNDVALWQQRALDKESLKDLVLVWT
jgi:hypothetical protein